MITWNFRSDEIAAKMGLDVGWDITNKGIMIIVNLNNIQENININTRDLNRLINENFDNRKKIMTISESNQEMIDVARECGASAKFAGSGGSIIGIYKDDAMLNRLIVNLKKINARVIKPYIV